MLVRMRWLVRTAVAVGVVGVIAACVATNVASPSGPFPTSTVPAAADCPGIDLRTPTGAPLDLTGTWAGGTTTHDVRQIGDCVWWMGRSTWPNQPMGGAWANVFFGHLHTDFTLTGEWVDVYRNAGFGGGPGHGSVTFVVDFPVVDGEEVIVLHRDTSLDGEGQGDVYGADTLRRVN